MSTFFVDPVMSAAVWIVVEASALLGGAALAQCVLRRRASAEIRHLVWVCASVGLLLLPFLSLAVPDWPVVIRPAAGTASDVPPAADPVQESAGMILLSAVGEPEGDNVSLRQSAGSIPMPTALAAPYATGTLVVLMPLLIQWWTVRRFARSAANVLDPEWIRLLNECAASMGIHRPVRLLRSRERSMPMTWGTRRPAILIPVIAETWSEDRRRAVILHELAHVARFDCLTQTLALATCAVYWFHPAVWLVARRLRAERELACDDRVIAAGTRPREYAGHLLEIAYAVGDSRAPALAVSMARPRQLENRMLAALDDSRNRTLPTWRVRLAGAGVSAVLLVSLAAATPTVAADLHVRRVLAAAASGPGAPGPAIVDESAAGTARAAVPMPGVRQDDRPGTWEIRPTKMEGTVHLRLVEADSSSGTTVPIAQLEGLTAAQLAGAGGPVQFRLRRDAGTFTFEGVLRNGVGAGTFTFAPDPNFPAELARRGFARPTEREQYQLARHDVGFAFVDELNKQGYSKPETSELVRAGQHGVHVTYLREMGGLGYRLGTLQPLIELRDHGVTPAYVRELAEQGYKGLSADELRRARDHGITPEYVRAMRDGGYGSLPMDQLVKARDHGVTPEFVRQLGEAGHRKLPLEQLIRVRDHGVTPEYVRELRELGHDVPIDDLVRARDHGVTQDYVRGMRDAGHGALKMEQLIRARDHGVTPEYAQELKALGYDRLTIEDLVTLRDHGLTPDRIRKANARAGTRLPVDVLRSLAAGGYR